MIKVHGARGLASAAFPPYFLGTASLET